jgi:hypothetical protein
VPPPTPTLAALLLVRCSSPKDPPKEFFFLFLDIPVQKDEDLEKRTSCSTTHRQLQEIRKLSRAPYFFLLYQFQNIF